MRSVADEIGAPTGPRIQHGGLRVYPVEPEADEIPMMRRYLGFEPQLSLVFAPYGPDDEFTGGQRNMLRAVAALARRGTRGLLFGEYGADASLILRTENGQVTLNSTWSDWEGPPDLKSAVPEPYDQQPLTFAR
jgi:hypothetical protein